MNLSYYQTNTYDILVVSCLRGDSFLFLPQCPENARDQQCLSNTPSTPPLPFAETTPGIRAAYHATGTTEFGFIAILSIQQKIQRDGAGQFGQEEKSRIRTFQESELAPTIGLPLLPLLYYYVAHSFLIILDCSICVISVSHSFMIVLYCSKYTEVLVHLSGEGTSYVYGIRHMLCRSQSCLWTEQRCLVRFNM